mmetsp:Transcript_5134/g.11210  ORF Transcript_5134/g.11210 Transcript_5134/m.11210 type:complete len:214 (-) Transcript_5134:7-648(-)
MSDTEVPVQEEAPTEVAPVELTPAELVAKEAKEKIEAEEEEAKAARRAMIAKRFGGNSTGASTGGSGSVRRKKRGSAKAGDDKKLGTVLKKLALSEIKGCEEVNIFLNDGTVIHIKYPKIQASVPSNTYVISGSCENKWLEELMPGVLNQLGPAELNYLRSHEATKGASGMGGGFDTVNEGDEEEEEDEDPEEKTRLLLWLLSGSDMSSTPPC